MTRPTIAGVDLSTIEWKTLEEIYGPVDFEAAPGEAACILAEDPATGASTTLVRLPPGWSTSLRERHSALQEEVLLEGDIDLGSGRLEAPSYFCFPPGAPHGPGSTVNGAVLLVIFDGAVDIEYLD
jgi:hypothetical protein